jgi:cell wall-associated NlpC family hydrolase
MTSPTNTNGIANNPLNANGVGGPTNLNNYVNSTNTINLDPFNQPPVMKTFIYSPDIQVKIATSGGKEYDVSSDIVRGQLNRAENAASTFFCELANHKGQYTKDGGLFGRMDRITVYMKRTDWIQVFSGYLDQVPFAQMWAGNVTLRATCTLKRLLYTYWNPNLVQSAIVFNQLNVLQNATRDAQGSRDAGIGDLLGNLVCWVGGWEPQNVHIQDFPMKFYEDMQGEFQKMAAKNAVTVDQYQSLLLGADHTPGSGTAAGQAVLSTGPGLGPAVIDPVSYRQQVIAAVDARGLGPNTADIQSSYDIQEAGQTGQATRDNASREAARQLNQQGQNTQATARNADAAILAFACAYAESGWVMYANPTVPDSLNYHYDAPGPRGATTAMGLFQQGDGWGTTAQKMNVFASAGMFLDALMKIDGWRNMDPAQAIAIAQKKPQAASQYIPFIETAKNEVQGIRAGQGKFTPQNVAGVGLSSTGAGALAQSIVNMGAGIVGAPSVSENSPGGGALPIDRANKPQPDSEGAVNCARTLIGRPYVYGGMGPGAFDCSGLMQYCYRSIGREIGRTTSQQALTGRRVSSIAELRPGDAIQTNGGGHTMMYIGGGQTIQAYDSKFPVSVLPLPNPSEIYGMYRYAEWGGTDLLAPFNPAAGPGAAPGTGFTGGVGAGSDGAQEQIARNLFSYIFTPAYFAPSVANLFGGEKSFIDCQPLIQEVQSVARAGLRHFASAPNGDFMAYYPDFFGVDGKPITMVVENIEMKDVRINLSDDALTTHVYVNGDMTMLGQMQSQAMGWLDTAGVATVENESLFQRLRSVVLGNVENLNGNGVLQKYGVRPLQLEFNMVHNHVLEFLVACQLFMQKWAEQYETMASFTFMPELFPGMRIALADTGIAVYVSEVTHTFDWEQGFSTQAKIMAPSSTGNSTISDSVASSVPADVTTRSPIPTSIPGV